MSACSGAGLCVRGVGVGVRAGRAPNAFPRSPHGIRSRSGSRSAARRILAVSLSAGAQSRGSGVAVRAHAQRSALRADDGRFATWQQQPTLPNSLSRGAEADSLLVLSEVAVEQETVFERVDICQFQNVGNDNIFNYENSC